ncbi:MAG: hypothetical protein H6724_05470 [Sandaracinus sp.]|nr:hypothetical protein [Sandaracinus sp.]
MRMTGLWGLGVLVALGATGCSDQQYVGEGGFQTFALTEDTAPFVATDDGNLYIVEQRVELPLREPTDPQMAELSTDVDGLPWARRPWVERHDYELEVDWVVINLDDEEREVAFTINGINEFHEYLPGFTIDENEVIPEFAQWERSMILEPQERRYGTIREEQLDEVAVDLATVVNGVTNANLIVHPDSQSSLDPRATPFVPAVVPALVGFRAGLRATTPSNVVVELTVRVRDERGVVIENVDNAWELPVPEIFMPSSVVPPEE